MRFTEKFSDIFGIDAHSRHVAVENLYHSTERYPSVYWLQLLVATGIAQLGLVLNSTAVVIGAMLVSPLMNPIVQVGMAFTIGSLFLALKAAVKLFLSVLVAVSVSAIMTKALPYEELTNEILARTQPTALDLFVALFCGLAAAFTAARTAKDTATAAAGTAIAIALVPPLCVVGFGVGIMSAEVTYGSLMLFTANLAAIILVSNLFFFLMGFSDIDMEGLERTLIDENDTDTWFYKTAKSLLTPLKTQKWRALRFMLPMVFVLIVAIPLSEALKRVAWEIKVKKDVNALVSALEKEHEVIKNYFEIGHSSVGMSITIVGDPQIEESLKMELIVKLAAITGMEPQVKVDVLPSTEFMHKSLQTSAEWMSSQLAALRQVQMHDRIEGAGEPTERTLRRLRSDQLVKALLERIEGAINLVVSGDAQAEWFSWSFSIAQEALVLDVGRISDEALNESAKAMISTLIKRETGIEVSIRELRLPKTPLNFGANEADKLSSEEIAAIRSAASGRDLALIAYLRNIEVTKSEREKRKIEKANEALLETARNILPEERIIIKTSQEEWNLSLIANGNKALEEEAKAKAETEKLKETQVKAEVETENLKETEAKPEGVKEKTPMTQ